MMRRCLLVVLISNTTALSFAGTPEFNPSPSQKAMISSMATIYRSLCTLPDSYCQGLVNNGDFKNFGNGNVATLEIGPGFSTCVETRGCTSFYDAIVGGSSKTIKCWTPQGATGADISTIAALDSARTIYVSLSDISPSSMSCSLYNRQELLLHIEGLNCGFPSLGDNSILVSSVDGQMPGWASGFYVGAIVPPTKWENSASNIFNNFIEWQAQCLLNGASSAGSWTGRIYVCGLVDSSCNYSLTVSDTP